MRTKIGYYGSLVRIVSPTEPYITASLITAHTKNKNYLHLLQHSSH